MTLSIDLDTADILAVRSTLLGIENGGTKAITRAVNKALTGVRTDLTNEAANDLNLKKADIRDAIQIKRVTWKDITAKVYRTGKPVPLYQFKGTRQTKKGVSVQVKKSGAREILKHAFIATMKNPKSGESQHTGVFWRKEHVGESRRGWGLKHQSWFGTLPKKYSPNDLSVFRLKIKELYGPRVEDILDNKVVMERVLKSGNERLFKALEQEISYLLYQAGKA